MSTIVVAGRGPSVDAFDWDGWDGPVCAVSSAVTAVPRYDYWCLVDRAELFPQFHVLRCNSTKLIPSFRAHEWRLHPNVHTFRMVEFPVPIFQSHMAATGCFESYNTMLFVVQVLPQIGFDHLHFVGCDHIGREPVAAGMKLWHNCVTAVGYRWTCSSRESRLAEFVPVLDVRRAA